MFIQYIHRTFDLIESVECNVQICFQFEVTDGFIELLLAREMDGEEEINTDDDFKGWSIRPHQKPTRVSIFIILSFICLRYYIHRLVRSL